MSAPKSQYDQDLDALERTTFLHGYTTAQEDVTNILNDVLANTTTYEEMALLMRISVAMTEMLKVRFPQPDQKN